MRPPLAQRTSSPSNSNLTTTPMIKKRVYTKLLTYCAAPYLLITVAFLLSYPNQVLTHFKKQPFYVAAYQSPLVNDTNDINFSNTPMSSMRPRNQFFSRDRWSTIGRISDAQPPILTIITVTKNARDIIRDTANFMLEQSLSPIRWLIVNDHTDKQKSYQLLQHIASLDRRFSLVNSTRKPGFSNGRIYGLNNLLSAPTKYFAFLDDDDFFEYTAYEKCIWMLESNINASMCGTYVLGFGERNYTWQYGFHNGYKIVVSNPLTGSEILRTSVLETDCGFDESLQTGMEDWDFYLCLASRGLWGLTIPEYLFWYRINPESLRKKRWGSLFEERDKKSDEIRHRYRELESNFPRVAIDSTTEFETVNLSLPFKNDLHLKKSVLMIIPWMSNGDGDTATLRLVQGLSTEGYRVTIVCTLLNLRGNSTASRPLFMQYTHDIFIIPAIIRLSDAPRFLAYLIESRNIQKVLVSNSQLGYGLLPWLSARYPDVTFVDFVHSQEPDWKNGGYAAFSTIHQTSLDATFTSSEEVRQYITQRGHDPSTVEVGNFEIALNRLHPLQDQRQAAARFALGIPAETTVVLFLARTVAFRRAKVATAAFLQVAKNTGLKGAENMSNRLRLLIIGDGPAMEESKKMTSSRGNLVTMLGNLRHTEALKYLELSDIFCIPSPSKKVSFILTESRKFGIEALTSTIGGFPEMLVRNTSNEVMVQHSGRSSVDVAALTDKMDKLLHQFSLRRERERVSDHSRNFLGANERLSELIGRILMVKRTRRRSRGAHTELSALHYTLASVVRDVGVLSDFPEIHKTMQGKDRGAYGTRYRAICGTQEGFSLRLLDILENPKSCLDGEDLDVKKMRTNAMSQCWRTCIMDLDDPKLQSGWHAKEKCQGFETFDDPAHSCATWYQNLPPEKRVDLEEE